MPSVCHPPPLVWPLGPWPCVQHRWYVCRRFISCNPGIGHTCHKTKSIMSWTSYFVHSKNIRHTIWYWEKGTRPTMSLCVSKKIVWCGIEKMMWTCGKTENTKAWAFWVEAKYRMANTNEFFFFHAIFLTQTHTDTNCGNWKRDTSAKMAAASAAHFLIWIIQNRLILIISCSLLALLTRSNTVSDVPHCEYNRSFGRWKTTILMFSLANNGDRLIRYSNIA